MSEGNNFYFLHSSLEKIKKKFEDKSLTEEERDELDKKAHSLGKKLRELHEKRKNEKKLTPEEAEKILESANIPEPDRTKWEILLAMWKASIKRENLPQDIKEKLEKVWKKKD